MTTFTNHSHLLQPSRATAIPTALRASLARAGASVWKALCASGEFRARQHMLNFAAGCEALQPSLAAELRAAGAHLGAR